MNVTPYTFIDGFMDRIVFEQSLRDAKTPLDLFRRTLHDGTARIQEMFNQGEPVDKLVAARAWLIDFILEHIWRWYMPEQCAAALVAVGGYGRGELHPASDIDIMILVRDTSDTELHGPIEHLLMCFWDIGLEVGHSVRSVADCANEAAHDITVVTNLIEARLLIGDAALYAEMQEAISPAHMWPSGEFFEHKMREQQRRHRGYDDTSNKLEPNVKESPGGLRDIQIISWVAKRQFGTARLEDLVESGFLSSDELHALLDGRLLLWKIRFALHIVSHRREDRLLFDNQRALAALFGYHDQEHELGVEMFMQKYYRTAMELSRLNLMLLQLFQEVILNEKPLPPPVPLNKRFQARGDLIEAIDERVFERNPLGLLEVFHLLQQHEDLVGVQARTIRLIRNNRHLIDNEFRNNLGARALFMDILRQPRGIARVLQLMNQFGVLAAYIPAFANIVGRMQYDLFHVYTVDQHTLFVIRNLRRFSVPEFRDEFPLCSNIMDRLPKPELIYLGAMFHDIAKGRGGDHSELGAVDAYEFCRHHHLSDYDSRLVAWLVKQHLIMSMTAQRQDISDPGVVQAFAEKVGDPNRLDYLYLLTVADIRSTDPKRWNSWKNAILRELYMATRSMLLRGVENPLAVDELIQAKRAEALELLRKEGIPEADAIALWINFNIEYFLHNSPNSIAWQTKAILKAADQPPPLITVRKQASRGGTEVMFYGPDHDKLFAVTTSVLDQLGLNIMDARIMTTDSGLALNTFTVLEEDGSPVTELTRSEEIKDTLRARIALIEETEIKVRRRTPRQQKHFKRSTEVSFYDDPSGSRTIMRLAAQDRPGLLAEVGYAFAICGTRLSQAKIATVGAEVDDVFFVTDNHNRPLNTDTHMPCLREVIIERLSSDA